MADKSFIENLRDARSGTKAEEERVSNIIKDWDDITGQFGEAYNAYRKNSGGRKALDKDDMRDAIRGFIKKAAVADGKWTQEQIDNSDYDETDFQEYGTKVLKDLVGEMGGMDFETYLDQHGSKEQKDTYKRVKEKEEAEKKDPVGQGAKKAFGAGLITLLGPAAWAGAQIGYFQDKGQRENLKKIADEYDEKHRNALNDAFDMFENSDSYFAKQAERNKNAKPTDGGEKATGTETTTDNSGDTVTFSLPRGNDPNYRGFGQKLVDLGLATDNGLWGENGDVAYYTKQLNNQGIYGNLPIGKNITLTRRK